MFRVTVDKGNVRLSGKKDIQEMMLGITMAIHAIWECDEFNKTERDLFKRYVQEKLGHLAFISEDELEKEVEKIEKKEEEEEREFEESRKNLVKMIGEENVKKLEDVMEALFS